MCYSSHAERPAEQICSMVVRSHRWHQTNCLMSLISSGCENIARERCHYMRFWHSNHTQGRRLHAALLVGSCVLRLVDIAHME